MTLARDLKCEAPQRPYTSVLLFDGSLKALPLYSGMSEKGRALLLSSLVTTRLKTGAIAIQRGQPVAGAYIVLTGRLRVFTVDQSGSEATLYMLHSGEACVLGLNALFQNVAYPAWVQAEQDTTVGVVPSAAFRQLFDTEPAARNLTIDALSTLVFRLMDELESVHSTPQRGRLIRLLLTHADESGTIYKTQQELAFHLGTTREVVARLLKGLVTKGWVETRRGRVVIKDFLALRSTY